MIKHREEGIERLYPSIFNSRFYYLTQLRKQIQSVSELFLKNAKELTLLDLGCGNMPYEPVFKNHVKQYIGADLAENPRASIHVSAKGIVALADQSTDIVLSTQVLEHVEDPIHYLSEAHRLLKNDGLLILSTHGYWMYHPDPTDFWRWTCSGLQKIITERGFEVVYFRGIIGRSAMGLQLFQDGLIFKVPPFLRPVFSVFMQPLILLFDKITKQSTRDKDACTFVVVAKRK
jgi:SAM-dependent methyltransferase